MEMATPQRDESPTIEMTGVRVMRGRRVALTVDRLAVHPGITALIGPNGSGKSTLLHTISGVLTPLAGEVQVLGHSPAESRSDVAYVLQSQSQAAARPITAREVVTLGLSTERRALRPLTAAQRERVANVMERMEITALANHFLSDMSGGQRQRVLIAQGLVQDAAVLLLDEPISGLDIASAATIQREMEAERDKGRTVIVATHDLGEAAGSDAAVLVSGRVIAYGEPSAVLTAEHLQVAYAGRILDIDGKHLALDDGEHHHHH